MVGFRLEELVDQVAVRGMNFDPVETRRLRPFGSAPVILNDSCDLVRFEGSWCFIRLFARRRVDRVTIEFDR